MVYIKKKITVDREFRKKVLVKTLGASKHTFGV